MSPPRNPLTEQGLPHRTGGLEPNPANQPALSDYGVVFAVPYGTLVVFVGIAILAGLLAAILPARRASRVNVLEALQYE